MGYVKNLPAWQRVLRIIGGAALAAAGIWVDRGAAFTAGAAGGGLFIALTGFFGFCPACALVGRRIDQAAQSAKARSAG